MDPKAKKELFRRIKIWKSLSKILFKLFSLLKRKDLLIKIINFTYETLDIQYIIKTIEFKSNNSEWGYQKMIIWYFEVQSIKNWTYNIKSVAIEKYIDELIVQNFIQYCQVNNINYEKYFAAELYWKTLKWWINSFSSNVWQMVTFYINKYYLNILTEFNNSFEKDWSRYMLIDEKFLQDQRRLKLFREIKYSIAQKYFTDWLERVLKTQIINLINSSKKKIADTLQHILNKYNSMN